MDRSTINTAEAARRAGVSGDTIRRWIRLGLLHTDRVGPGRRYRISADELTAVINGPGPTVPVPALTIHGQGAGEAAS